VALRQTKAFAKIDLLGQHEGNGSGGNQTYVQTLETINLDCWICIRWLQIEVGAFCN